jgi:hypothetical protein
MLQRTGVAVEVEVEVEVEVAVEVVEVQVQVVAASASMVLVWFNQCAEGGGGGFLPNTFVHRLVGCARRAQMYLPRSQLLDTSCTHVYLYRLCTDVYDAAFMSRVYVVLGADHKITHSSAFSRSAFSPAAFASK